MFAGLLVVCICVPLGAFVFAPRPNKNVTEGNFGLVEVGMAKTEVDKILGPPTKEPRGDVVSYFHEQSWAVPPPVAFEQDWIGVEYIVSISFDADHQVISKKIGHVNRELTIIERLREWLPELP
jgi:hypothetical protein